MQINIKKAAKKVIKATRGKINFLSIEKFLDTIGYKIVFFNNPIGDSEVKRYHLDDKARNTKAFTYSSTAKVVFIDNNVHSSDKLYLLLHELGHILLEHLGDGKLFLRNAILIDIEADSFTYAVLNYKRNYKPLYFAICLVLASVISATAGYNLHSDDTPPPEQYNVPISNSITPATEPTETQAPVINENNTGFVYVTKSSTRYHKANCQYVRNNNTATAIKADEANKRYTPCKVCNPN